MNQTAQKPWLKYLICVLLAGITYAAFASVASHVFIAFDDQDYIVGNLSIQQGFSWPAIKWAFTTFHSGNWHPLTWLSHMLDCRLFGLDPAGPHLVNLAFHIANTLLLFLLLLNLTSRLWAAAFVALLFGIHPMHVESVAWASERKDVLSTFFFLLTLLAYARYVELVKEKKSMCWMAYVLAFGFAALGLMAKPMLVTLPGILFLLDFWPMYRFQWPLQSQPKSIFRRLILEKIPFAILAGLSCWITFVAHATMGAVKEQSDFSLSQRLSHLPVSYVWYIFKLFWPSNLSIFYPLQTDVGSQDIFFSSILLLVLSAFAFWRARKSPYLLVGWFWFVGMMVPVIGLVQVGNQSYADRYTYLPYLGLFIILAWGVPELLAKLPGRRVILWIAAMVILAACFWRTVVESNTGKTGCPYLPGLSNWIPKMIWPGLCWVWSMKFAATTTRPSSP